eukprot:CAMPEP_0184317132 /NCGR_PEP_ID=MMETSP1049-20130417/94713_1 /TAXON_ID=77928 /ORGANISM="Proteomonas sulcata, Strain CCMP704" /LENGTH=101 /DNA_ID=CAMNT_0026636399 /DNA_START=27 /DNA_END=329 /DNA_ORIENTATION=-
MNLEIKFRAPAEEGVRDIPRSPLGVIQALEAAMLEASGTDLISNAFGLNARSLNPGFSGARHPHRDQAVFLCLEGIRAPRQMVPLSDSVYAQTRSLSKWRG